MAAYCTVAGLPAVDARICLPRVGVWHADVVLDAESAPAGRVDLSFAGVPMQGTVTRGAAVDHAARVRIVAGAGGMAKTVPPKSYLNLPFRIPLGDIASAAGERVSERADPALLNTFLPRWAHAQGKASSALANLLEGRAVTWRMLPDGALWVGTESWPANELEHELLDEDPITDSVTVYLEQPSLMPGQTFRGKRVSYVEHQFSEQLRTRVWFE